MSGGGSFRETAVALQLKVKTQCVVNPRHDVCRGPPEDRAKPLDGDQADLLGLGLEVQR